MNAIQTILALQDALFSLIRQAGTVIVAASTELTEAQIDSKAGSANFVTTYDIQVQHILEDGIRSVMPSCTFLAEEAGEDHNPIGDGWTFVIDPIDGTANFIHNYRWSAISVGALYKGDPVWGAVYQPYTAEMFYAAKGQGAYLNGQRIAVSNRVLSEAIVAFGTSPYQRARFGRPTMELAKDILMEAGDIRRSGSAALDLCYVACGRVDAFYELELCPWDFMAGKLLIQEAGGWITTMDGQALPVDGRKSCVAAGGPTLKQDFLALLEKGRGYVI